ncbi:MAG: methyltransferase [Bacteroidota bacterium]
MYYRLLRKLQPVLYSIIKWYYRKPREFKKRDIRIKLLPTVFHPSLNYSTDIFLDYLLTLPLYQKCVLELGAGNGFISLYLAMHRNCQMVSSDINPKAIEGLRENAAINQVQLTAILSNLFDKLKGYSFDYILVNPPYFPKQAETTDELAYYCGANFEFFHEFFLQVKPYLQSGSECLMILSDTAPTTKIIDIAQQKQLSFQVVSDKITHGEVFSIYSITSVQ